MGWTRCQSSFADSPSKNDIEDQSLDALEKTKIGAALGRVVKVRAAWQSQARREVRELNLTGEEVSKFLAELLERPGLWHSEKLLLRLRACLYLAQLIPTENVVPTLQKIVTSEEATDLIRMEAAVSIGRQKGGVDEVKQLLKSKNDRIRAAAIRALALLQNKKETADMIAELKGRKTDFTGTHTGTALSEARTFLDISEAFSSANGFREQILFLLSRLPYEQPPPPAEPTLAQDAASVFVWQQLESMWKQDSKEAREVFAQYSKAHPDREKFIKLLLRDLAESEKADPK
jgi:HEAT repeat protein